MKYDHSYFEISDMIIFTAEVKKDKNFLFGNETRLNIQTTNVSRPLFVV
jgi:hypothetical protein